MTIFIHEPMFVEWQTSQVDELWNKSDCELSVNFIAEGFGNCITAYITVGFLHLQQKMSII